MMNSSKEIMSEWRRRAEVAPEELAFVEHSYGLSISNTAGECVHWLVRTNPITKIEQVESIPNTCCKLELSELQFLLLANRETSLQQAFLANQIRIKGSIEQSLKFNLVFESLNSSE